MGKPGTWRRPSGRAGAKSAPMVWNYRDLWDYARELARMTTEQGDVLHVLDEYGFVLNMDPIPFCREDYDLHQEDQHLMVHWVIPEPTKGSGGHTTIFRTVTALEKQGLHNRIYIREPKLIRTDAEAAEYLNHPEKLNPIRENGIRFAQQTDWEQEMDKVYHSLIEGIREDTEHLP